MERCAKCAGELFEARQKGQHVGVYCLGCGAWIRWISQPITLEKAQAFEMPWGKHKGKQLGQLEDSYLDWLFENVRDGKIPEMARLVYENRVGVP